MDEFQYQLYLSKIKSLKGTKKPLRDLAIEINNFAPAYKDAYEYHQLLYKQQILIRNIIEFSTAVKPVPKYVLTILDNNLMLLVTSKHITAEQAKILIQYRSGTYYHFMPHSLSELHSINAKVQFIDIRNWGISLRELYLGNRLTITESTAYLYVTATMPDSLLLKKFMYNYSEELKEYVNELSDSLKIVQDQLKKEPDEQFSCDS